MAFKPLSWAKNTAGSAWGRFSRLSRRAKTVIIALLVIVVVVLLAVLHHSAATDTGATLPTVTLENVSALGNGSGGVAVVGTVQSVSQADLLAQSSGTVTAVNTKLGASVPAGFVIASLDSAAAAASVLQAQGAYDSALAAQQATDLQAQNSTGSLADEQMSVRTLYQTDYTTMQNTLTNDVDVFFGQNTSVGPQLQIRSGNTGDNLSRERAAITDLMNVWERDLPNASVTDPITLLSSAQSYLTQVNSFLADLNTAARAQDSRATATQLQDLSAAQASVNSMLSGVSQARTAYNTASTNAAVGQTQKSGGGDAVTSSEANVEQALGGLRAAQAAYEKTVIRAPIAGTVNYLNIHVGDFVTMNQRVATVARNNALQVVLHLSQADAERVAVGDTVSISGGYAGEVTTVAPALDPQTKQIEVDIAVNDAAGSSAALVNGQSVQVTLPALPSEISHEATGMPDATGTSTASTTASALLLPLTAVKLQTDERDVFTVDSTGHIVAHPVQIGDVIGDRIQVTTPLPAGMDIVVDARGLSAGDAVQVASSTPASP